jgi:hypothetical protein
LEVLKNCGVVAIATQGQDGPHLVNTWHSYMQITSDSRLLIPAGYMQQAEANIASNNNGLITVGSSKVADINGPVCHPDIATCSFSSTRGLPSIPIF